MIQAYCRIVVSHYIVLIQSIRVANSLKCVALIIHLDIMLAIKNVFVKKDKR